ncbi:MAG: RNA polymerase sigma factor [Bdellovibrionales bacterium]
MVEQSSDYELLQRTARGDTRAYRELIGRHLVRGVKVAERMLGNRQDAEDVMQETCLKIWKEASRWKPQAKFSTWLYRVVLNACIDRKRLVVPAMTNEMDDILDPKPVAEDEMIERQRSASVRQALQRLPDRQRAAVVLSYYEEMSNQDSADLMDIGLGAFQQLLFRAKQNLKENLVEEEEHDNAKTGS